MNSHSSFLSVRTLTEALVAKLRAIRWVRGSHSEPAFSQVATFDVRDLAVALAELAVVGDRVCLIVLGGEEFTSDVRGTDLHISHRLPFTLLLADKNFGDRQASFFGDERTAGAVTLRDLVLGLDATGTANFLGLLLPQVYVRPIGGEPFILTEAQRTTLAGFGVWAVDCEAVGGAQQLSLGRHPIV